jgi:hypothetical protein
MENTLSILKEAKSCKGKTVQVWREQPASEDWLFQATDAVGRSGWFLRLSITGLYPRRIGPYPTREEALDALEEVLAHIITDPLCDLENEMHRHGEYVVEGVPLLQPAQAPEWISNSFGAPPMAMGVCGMATAAGAMNGGRNRHRYRNS